MVPKVPLCIVPNVVLLLLFVEVPPRWLLPLPKLLLPALALPKLPFVAVLPAPKLWLLLLFVPVVRFVVVVVRSMVVPPLPNFMFL